MKTMIAASILNANFAKLEEEIKQAEQAGVDWIHLDIMDGHFVPNISFGPNIIKIVRGITELPLDAHLMISNPDQFIPVFAQSGVNYISVHIENNPHIHRTIQSIHAHGCKPGIVLNPGTPINAIFSVLPYVKYVLMMSVNPGFGGQSFIPETARRIEELQEFINNSGYEIPIEVDGGIDEATSKIAIEAGAQILVSGSFIFNNEIGVMKAVSELRK